MEGAFEDSEWKYLESYVQLLCNQFLGVLQQNMGSKRTLYLVSAQIRVQVYA